MRWPAQAVKIELTSFLPFALTRTLTLIILMASAFYRSYAQALSVAASRVAHPAAFVGRSFGIYESGYVDLVMPLEPTAAERHLRSFMEAELESKLALLDWSTVWASENEELNPSFAVNEYLEVVLRYEPDGRGVSVEVECTDVAGFTRYLEEIGHVGAP